MSHISLYNYINEAITKPKPILPKTLNTITAKKSIMLFSQHTTDNFYNNIIYYFSAWGVPPRFQSFRKDISKSPVPISPSLYIFNVYATFKSPVSIFSILLNEIVLPLSLVVSVRNYV